MNLGTAALSYMALSFKDPHDKKAVLKSRMFVSHFCLGYHRLPGYKPYLQTSHLFDDTLESTVVVLTLGNLYDEKHHNLQLLLLLLVIY
jgi:hypothetical protein